MYSFISGINSERYVLALAGGFICEVWLMKQSHPEKLTFVDIHPSI